MGYLLLASILWSFSFGLVAEQLKVMNSLHLASSRLWLSAIAFSIPMVLFPTRDLSLKTKVQLILLGTIQFGLMYLIYIESYAYLKAWEVALWTITTPIWVLVCSGGGQNLAKAAAAALLATLGAYFMKPAAEDHATHSYAGILLIQAANFCFALGQVLYRKIAPKGVNPSSLFFWPYLGAAIASTIPCLLWTDLALNADFQISDGLRLVYLGVVASGIGFALWNHGATKVDTAVLVVWNNLKIPIAVVTSFVFFDALPKAPKRTALGILVLSLALIVASYSKTAKKKLGSAQA